jgi:capsule polysaccharide modification protein KpsS
MAHRKEDPINERFENTSLKKKKGYKTSESEVSKDAENKQEKYILPPIAITKEAADQLRKHFKKKGTSLSGGVRMVLYEYIERKL